MMLVGLSTRRRCACVACLVWLTFTRLSRSIKLAVHTAQRVDSRLITRPRQRKRTHYTLDLLAPVFLKYLFVYLLLPPALLPLS
jgi:hypothetical protein